MPLRPLDSELMNYIAERGFQPGDQLPSLNDLSEELGINVGKLREQLEVARSLGLVEVRPRTGIRCKAYDFLPAIRLSLFYALATDARHFYTFTDLRNHVEMAFWAEAVGKLTDEDKTALRALIDAAWAKLNHPQFVQIPHREHREFHMRMFARLDNPFVMGILEAYWEAYEAVELNAYFDLHYWQEAWTYHEKILNHIVDGQYEQAQQVFEEHTRLLTHRSAPPVPGPGLEASEDGSANDTNGSGMNDRLEPLTKEK